MIKKILKKLIPSIILKIIRVYRSGLFEAYLYDINQYIKYSNTFERDNNESKLKSTIILKYHIIEKGLTMPNMRFLFGQENLKQLINACLVYSTKYNKTDLQVKHAVNVLCEYLIIHNEHNIKIDYSIEKKILELKNKFNITEIQEQVTISDEKFFKNSNEKFSIFAQSRQSVRNYSEQIVPTEEIMKAISIAQLSPSACNRQLTRVHLVETKDDIERILALQGGNRGFGHLTNKLLIITSDQSGFVGARERNAAGIDAGIYSMSLVYALHYLKIGSCILNWGVTPDIDKQLRNLCKIPNNEKAILIVICGYLPNKLKIAQSKKLSVSDVLTIHN